jgi:hormone-sensitive lipase
MSPYIHQAYVRKWANNLNTPIFSVDYRKSPEYAFPSGLDDCFQAYVWMIRYLEKIFGKF